MAAYDEIHDESGDLRAAYAAIRLKTGVDLSRPLERVISVPWNGVTPNPSIHPVPLVLSEAEYQSTIVPGVLQRAFTLQALFEDIAIGSASLLNSGLLSGDELEWILGSEGVSTNRLRQLWQNQSREQIRFIYGPDLVRTPEGNWVVLEDNVGCLGGIAQAPTALDSYLEAMCLPEAITGTLPDDLRQAVTAFLLRVSLRPDVHEIYGFAGWLSTNGNEMNDFETRWKADCLRSLRITVIEPGELLDRIRRGAANPAAIINLSATFTPAYEELAKSVFLTSKIPVFGAPALGWVASKSFLPIDGALTQRYLREDIVLKSAPSRLIREMPETLPTEGVLKRSNGCRGTEVFFLDQLRTEEPQLALLAAIRQWAPCTAILQDPVQRSVLLGSALEGVELEIRPIVYVYGWRAALVGEVVAGRAIPSTGDIRGNISRGARFLPVLREANVSRRYDAALVQ